MAQKYRSARFWTFGFGGAHGRTQLAQARSSGWTPIGTGSGPHTAKFPPGDYVKAEF